MQNQCRVPQKRGSAEIEVKKSRFISWAVPVTSREDVALFVQEAKKQFPDARHHCWAYQLGTPPNNAGMSDDGEPSGTAGKPILNILQHKNISNCVLIVIRYFGGIKLGAGGLVRAYSAAAQAVVESLLLTTHEPTLELNLSCSFAQEQDLRHWLSLHKGAILSVSYSEQVLVNLKFPEPEFETFVTYAAAQDMDYQLISGNTNV